MNQFSRIVSKTSSALHSINFLEYSFASSKNVDFLHFVTEKKAKFKTVDKHTPRAEFVLSSCSRNDAHFKAKHQ